MKNKFYDFCNNFIYVVFALFSIAILATRIYSFVTYFSSSKVLELGSLVGLVVVAFIFCLLYKKDFINKVADFLKKSIKCISNKVMLIVITVSSLISKLVLLFLFQIDSSKHPDIENYWSFIQQLSKNGKIVDNISYATRFSYTVIYSTFYVPITKLLNIDNILSLNVYLCVLFSICALLIYDLVKYYKGKNWAFATSMLWVLLPLGMVEPLLLVHENGFVVLHIIAIWLYFRVLPSLNKLIFKAITVIGIGLILAYAAHFNKFAIICILAVVIVEFLKLVEQKINVKNLVSAVAILLVLTISYVGVGSLCTTFKENVINIDNDMTAKSYSVPYAWGLYLGFNYDSHGTWNEKDRDIFKKYKDFDNKQDAQAYQKKLVLDRISEYKKNPIKLFGLYFNKLDELWAKDFNPVLYGIGNNINDKVLTWHDGIIQSFINVIFLFIDIILAFVLVGSIKLKNNKHKKEIFLLNYLKMFLIGCTVAVIPFEVTCKYSSHMLFVFLILIVMSLPDFKYNMDKLLLRKRNK